jgi:broad specificity phosphatase PhoE
MQNQSGNWNKIIEEEEHFLILVRHGETQWNAEDRLTTHSDIPLNNAGREQAEQAGLALEGASFDALFSSPLIRAFETSEIIKEHLSVETIKRPTIHLGALKEPSAGEFEGQTFSDLRSGSMKERFADYQSETNPIFPDGCQSVAETLKQTKPFIDKIASGPPGRYLAVSHGTLIKILMHHFIQADPNYYRRFKLNNCHAVIVKFFQPPKPDSQVLGFNLPPNYSSL